MQKINIVVVPYTLYSALDALGGSMKSITCPIALSSIVSVSDVISYYLTNIKGCGATDIDPLYTTLKPLYDKGTFGHLFNSEHWQQFIEANDRAIRDEGVYNEKSIHQYLTGDKWPAGNGINISYDLIPEIVDDMTIAIVVKRREVSANSIQRKQMLYGKLMHALHVFTNKAELFPVVFDEYVNAITAQAPLARAEARGI